MDANEITLLEIIEQKQKEYFRLSIQVAVVTSVFLAAALQELNTSHHGALLFYSLILAGNVPQLFSWPKAMKFAGGAAAIAGAIGSVVVGAPHIAATTIVGSTAGALSGALSIGNGLADSNSTTARVIGQVLELRTIYTVDGFLQRLGWKKQTSPLGAAFPAHALKEAETKKSLTYVKAKVKLVLKWRSDPSRLNVKFDEGGKSKAFHRAEKRAIEEYVKYQDALCSYYETLSNRAGVPLKIAGKLVGQVPTLLDRYDHPERYLGDSDANDMIRTLFGSLRHIPQKPAPKGESVQQLLLAYYEVRGKGGKNLRKSIEDANSTRWSEFQARLKQIKRLSIEELPSGQGDEDFRAVKEMLDKELDRNKLPFFDEVAALPEDPGIGEP